MTASNSIILPQAQKSSICPLCQGKKLLPFIKNGKSIPHVFVDCDCQDSQPPLPYQRLNPEDIDFPVSRDWYRFYANCNHWLDPGSITSESPDKKSNEFQKIDTIVKNYIVKTNITKKDKGAF